MYVYVCAYVHTCARARVCVCVCVCRAHCGGVLRFELIVFWRRARRAARRLAPLASAASLPVRFSWAHGAKRYRDRHLDMDIGPGNENECMRVFMCFIWVIDAGTDVESIQWNEKKMPSASSSGTLKAPASPRDSRLAARTNRRLGACTQRKRTCQ